MEIIKRHFARGTDQAVSFAKSELSVGKSSKTALDTLLIDSTAIDSHHSDSILQDDLSEFPPVGNNSDIRTKRKLPIMIWFVISDFRSAISARLGGAWKTNRWDFEYFE